MQRQEQLNTLTHGAGILLSLIGLPFLYYLAAGHDFSVAEWFALGIYSVSLLMVYTSSTLYHAWNKQEVKEKLQKFDHVSIYFLIAGTTTFFVLKYTGTFTATVFLSLQWALVLAGTIFKIFYAGRYKLLSTLLYLALGLMVLFISHRLWHNMSAEVLGWIIAGGGFYVSGTLFYMWKKLPYQHAIWHLFVLGGSVSHFLAFAYSISKM